MQISVETIIAAGRASVWKAFEDADNLQRWQPTLKSCELVSGVSGQPGSIVRLVYDENGHKVEMQGQVTERRALEVIRGTYETPVERHTVENIFSQLDEGTTRWRMTSDYRFKGLMPRLMSRCLRGTITRRIIGDMQRFKTMVETDLGADLAA